MTKASRKRYLFSEVALPELASRLAIDRQEQFAIELLKRLQSEVGSELAASILRANQNDEPGIYEQRQRVELVKSKLRLSASPDAQCLLGVIDMLVRKGVWIVGGDG